MRRDETVICLGEDIGAFGGAFKVTDGFIEEFGAARVIDTPLAENAIIGAAVGAATEGLKPVCEMQFADFISCGFDQLVNVAAKLHYRQGVAAPDGGPPAIRRRLLGRAVPLAEPRGMAPSGPRPEGRRTGDGSRRKGAPDQRNPRPQSGLLPRAQGPLPQRQGRGSGGRVRRADRQSARCPRGL